MGGNAFSDVLPDDAFPRIPSDVYNGLKTQITTQLRLLFAVVETPREAPEKPDHGDIDFTVFGSKDGTVTHQRVREAIGAEHAVEMAGNRTSNYAIPSRTDPGRYHQIDVHICDTEEELERIVFFNSYGDLGMLLGLLARAHGLSLGTKGLKILAPQADETHPPSFHLSSNFHDIMPFYGLSMDTRMKGFNTQESVFEWVSTSRFYDPRRLSDPKGRENERKRRSMYQAFLGYSRHHLNSGGFDTSKPSLIPEDIIQESLVYFDRKDEYDEIVRTNRNRRALKEKFNGTLIMEWTGLYGKPIREVMDGMKARIGEGGIVASDLNTLRELAREVQTELGLNLPASAT
ncbi:hypothetical protein BD410DRAFT_747250 [Rickenella mellea]|uniref:Uncharacterized protein n=1 Tax=Rickenella mellea TaxID=50990 RepID=A0A4Y7Q7M4_9AGAM|nr:hypothetical protein BD410DRAFT_747250 [Rickenella mellea]